MIRIAPMLEDLGLPGATLADVIELISKLPFEHTMLVVSVLAAEVYHHGRDRDRQLRLASSVLAPELFRRLQHFIGCEPASVVFNLRYIIALQRLLITHAAPDEVPARRLDQAEAYLVGAALFGLASALPNGDPPETDAWGEPDWLGWTRFFAQTAAWHDEPFVLEAIARTQTIAVDVAASPELVRHPARVEIDARLQQTYRLTIAQQLAAGLVCAYGTKAITADVEVSERAVHIAPGFLAASSLAAHEPAVVRLISATREELCEAVGESGDDAESIAWDHTALERYPFLRLPDGTMRLSSPRALVAWMTRGLHYRLLDAFESSRARTRVLTFAGALGEGYVRELVRDALRSQHATGAVTVHGEVEFYVGKERRDGPDVVIDAGSDVVMIEVYSGRMARHARSGADAVALDAFVRRSVAVKLTEVRARVQDLLDGYLEYPELQMANVRRIWPLLVLAGDVIGPSPLVWQHLRNTAPAAFSTSDGRVQHPRIFGLDDLEPLLALVEEGNHLPDLLARFARSDYAELLPRNWITSQYFSGHRPAFVLARFRSAMQSAHDALFT